MNEMRKILFAAVAALITAGCSPEVDESGVGDPASPISIATEMSPFSGDIPVGTTDDVRSSQGDAQGPQGEVRGATRGTPVNSVEDMTTLALFVDYSGTDQWDSTVPPDGEDLVDQPMKKRTAADEDRYDFWEFDNSNGGNTANQVWKTGPGTSSSDHYTFSAYAPYRTSANGISVISSAQVESALSKDAALPHVAYSVPSTVANQPDLMFAGRRNNVHPTGNPVPLKMSHALTAVGVNISGQSKTVSSVTVTGVVARGIAEVDGDNIEWDPSYIDAGGAKQPSPATGGPFEIGITLDGGAYRTASDGWLMMLPQELTDAATLTIIFSGTDAPAPLSYNLGDHKDWAAGKRVVYNINPEGGMEVTEFEVDKNSLTFDAVGGTQTLSVTSTVGGNPVDWTTEYSDDGVHWYRGLPEYMTITKGPTNSAGVTQVTLGMSAVSAATPDPALGFPREVRGSESDPWNLASTTGGATEETANCYIVNTPGWYELPLAYGNSIQGGIPVSTPYDAVRTDTPANFLLVLTRHDGAAITASYIYDNSFASPIGDATLVWMDSPGLVTDVRLDGAQQFLRFRVSPASIAQGNAIVAVRDAAGEIMWSWHIWIVPPRIVDASAPAADEIATNGSNPHFWHMQYPLGFTEGRTTQYTGHELDIRFVQNMPGYGSKEVGVSQGGLNIDRGDAAAYYQWGRKDPMIPSKGIGRFTSGSSREVFWGIKPDNTYTINNDQPTASSGGNLTAAIQNPHVFYRAARDWNTPQEGLRNLWDMESDRVSVNYGPVVKTVYDPSPAGFVLPPSGAYTGFTDDGDNHSSSGAKWNVNVVQPEVFDHGWNFYTTEWRTGPTVKFTTFGFVMYMGGIMNVDIEGFYWSAGAQSTTNSYYLFITNRSVGPVYAAGTSLRAGGHSIRPVKITATL